MRRGYLGHLWTARSHSRLRFARREGVGFAYRRAVREGPALDMPEHRLGFAPHRRSRRQRVFDILNGTLLFAIP